MTTQPDMWWVNEGSAIRRILERLDRMTTHPSARFPFAFIHAGDGCGYPAFYLKRKIGPSEPMTSRAAALLDGTDMPIGSAFVCGHCGRSMRMPRTAHIQELLPS